MPRDRSVAAARPGGHRGRLPPPRGTDSPGAASWLTCTCSAVLRWPSPSTRAGPPGTLTHFKPHGIVHEEALAVAAELGLPQWWLNEQASSDNQGAHNGACHRLKFARQMEQP